MIIRTSATTKRWIDIVLLSIAGAAGATFLLHSFPAHPELSHLSKWAFPPGAILLTILLSTSNKGRLSAWSGFRHFPSHPPTWLAALLGFALLSTYITLIPPEAAPVSCKGIDFPLLREMASQGKFGILLALTAGAFTTLIGRKASIYWATRTTHRAQSEPQVLNTGNPPRDTTDRTTTQALPPNAIAFDYNDLLPWIENDQPISHPRLDAFGHARIAKRITERLFSPSAKRPTLALIGTLGSGKTSVFNLVTHELHALRLLDTKISVARLSLWPFDTVEAAIRAILEKINKTLSQHINTTPMSGLSDEYINAIEAAGGSWGRLLKGTRDPSAILEDYNQAASAINLTIVVWIEDLERFAGTSTLNDETETDRLKPIRSLLHLLSEFQSLQIVLASSSLNTRFDIEKIARYVEAIPSIPPSKTANILNRFRQKCQSSAQNIIDPARPEARAHLNLPDSESERDLRFSLFSTDNLMFALATLCNNPRRLKFTLRSCHDIWERLRGEIDFDDVLAISAIRTAEPKIFSLINDHIDELRSQRQRDSNNKSLFAQKLEKILEERELHKRSSIITILNFTFPNWSSNNNFIDSSDKPQGLSRRDHRDYWNRYLSLAPLSADEQDQPILRAIKAWDNHTSDDLISILTHTNSRHTVEEFISCLISPNQLTRLLSEVIRLESKLPATTWTASQPESMVSVWRAMHKQAPPGDELTATIRQLVIQIAPSNLPLTHALIHFFAQHDSGVPSLLSDTAISEINQQFHSILSTKFPPTNAQALTQAINGGNEHTLFLCSWGLDRVRSGQLQGTPFDGWHTFSNTILTATEIEPEILIPQILPFITTHSREMVREANTPRWRGVIRFNQEAAESLFDIKRLYKIITQHQSSIRADHESRPALEIVLEAAHLHIGPK